ncbi:MAG TPA: ATP-binding protein [Chryseosolibacter sp.]|nr:ATP-binding protein [Chryseosolibacter sp.]
MAFSGFAVRLIIRLLAIVANCYALAFVFLLNQYLLTFINLIALLALQVYALFRYLTRWQNDLKAFSDSVKHDDFNIQYNAIDDRDPHREMYAVLNHISGVVRHLKSQVEQQNQYLQYVVENAQVGLVAYGDDGTVLLCNQEVFSVIGAQSLKNINALQISNPEALAHIKLLVPGQARLVVLKNNQSQKLSLRMSRIVVEGNAVNIISMLNISQELEENELQSWQDLISVLTHEIMNSITPIHSLNGSMSKYMDKIEGNNELVQKAKSSLAVINRRSQLLMDFVVRYRQISTVPLPEKKPVMVRALIDEVILLMQEQLRDIEVTVTGDDVKLFIDVGQIEQVLINLIKNAIHAMTDAAHKELSITIVTGSESVKVTITDNGQGVSADVASKIFIPFYTTRPEGSGIGLTISRQIMQRHGGRIEFASEVGKGTTFTLVFPATSP